MDNEHPNVGGRTFPFATILKSHGLAGELKVALELHDPAVLKPPFPATLVTSDGQQGVCEVLGMRGAGKHLLIKLDGIDDRDSADALQGARLLVAREAFPQPDEGEYYLGDLVGYEILLQTGDPVGLILEVWALPANDVLKVDHNGKEALIPLIDQVVKSIDHHSRTVVIVPMEGLLE